MKNRVQDLRKSINLTQEELARAVGVSRQTINYLEQEKYVPSLTVAMKIAEIFNQSIEDIFELESGDWDKKKGPTKSEIKP